MVCIHPKARGYGGGNYFTVHDLKTGVWRESEDQDDDDDVADDEYSTHIKHSRAEVQEPAEVHLS